jgi:LPXTG-motif cell wall-anchored protein
LLINRADDKLKNIILRSAIDKQKFAKVDDVISFVKEEAAKSNISSDIVDKLALKVGVMDNVLTQAAVDLIARNVRGELKEIVSGLNIYDAGLKTWTDLQKYVSEKTNGRIKPEDLNKITADILADIDTAISKMREKIIAYSDKAISGNLIKQSINTTDLKNIKNAGLWMQSVYNESININVKEAELYDLISKLTSLPNTDGAKYLEELTGFSDQNLKDYLNSSGYKKARAKTPVDIIRNLFRNRDKGYFSEKSLFNALVDLLSAKDISTETIASQKMTTGENNRWIIWVVAGAGLLILFIILWRRKKKDKKQD